MDIQAEKIALAKRLLDTENISLIKAIRSIFEQVDNSTDEWGNLHDEVVAGIKESLKQIEEGNFITHADARKTYEKWL